MARPVICRTVDLPTAQTKKITNVNPDDQKLRRALMQEPEEARAALDDSDRTPETQALLDESERFERTLQQALAVDPPRANESRRWLQRVDSPPGTFRRPAWMTAMAAVLVGAVGIAFTLAPRSGEAKRLQAAMLEHVSHEAGELRWAREHGSLPVSRLSDGRLGDQGIVTYLNLCEIDGVLAVHSIVVTDNGEVTALYLPDREISRAQDVRTAQLRGQMLTAGSGVSGFFGASKAAVSDVAGKHAATFAQAARAVLADSSKVTRA